MDNAFENENLEEVQGQVVDNVGQDAGQVQDGEVPGDWKNQAKYFQSQKDKLHSENQKLKQYEQIGNMLESRPDIVKTITGMVKDSGQPEVPQRIAMNKDEFDPWAAYNDPQSKSYQFRQQDMQDSISHAVEGKLAGVQRQVGITELKSRLKGKGLNDAQINSFMEFADRNPADYGVDGAINMWRSMTSPQSPQQQLPPSQQAPANPMSNVRQNVGAPRQAGVLNGQQPRRKTQKDSMWDAIVNSGSRTNVL